LNVFRFQLQGLRFDVELAPALVEDWRKSQLLLQRLRVDENASSLVNRRKTGSTRGTSCFSAGNCDRAPVETTKSIKHFTKGLDIRTCLEHRPPVSMSQTIDVEKQGTSAPLLGPPLNSEIKIVVRKFM